MSTVEEIRRKYGSEMADEIQKHLESLRKIGLEWRIYFNFTKNDVVIGIIDESFLELFIYSKKEKRMVGKVQLMKSELEDVLYQMKRLREVSKWPA